MGTRFVPKNPTPPRTRAKPHPPVAAPQTRRAHLFCGAAASPSAVRCTGGEAVLPGVAEDDGLQMHAAPSEPLARARSRLESRCAHGLGTLQLSGCATLGLPSRVGRLLLGCSGQPRRPPHSGQLHLTSARRRGSLLLIRLVRGLSVLARAPPAILILLLTVAVLCFVLRPRSPPRPPPHVRGRPPTWPWSVPLTPHPASRGGRQRPPRQRRWRRWWRRA